MKNWIFEKIFFDEKRKGYFLLEKGISTIFLFALKVKLNSKSVKDENIFATWTFGFWHFEHENIQEAEIEWNLDTLIKIERSQGLDTSIFQWLLLL